MSDQLKQRLSQLKQSSAIKCLGDFGIGLEKESLRVTPQGQIAQTLHPTSLGAPLSHPSITTDFSEALVEFITPVFHHGGDALNFLEDLHVYTFDNLDKEELLWISSMPCILDNDDDIPLAQYGSSNIAQLKTLYRSGLSYRYGRAMQTIAGIHFNFSFSDEFWALYKELCESDLNLQDFKTENYFNLIRNFKRYSWLLIYLFGASPAVCKSFVQKQPDHGLEEFDHASLFAPFGTSLRMGDLGYTSKAQADLYVCYNNLNSYAQGLTKAINTSYPPYEAFGPDTDDEGQTTYKQLNSSILQIENEFYSTIRPKRVTPSGKKPIEVLQEEGVEYIEVRCIDLDPFQPLGINEETISFLNNFLIFCLLRASPKTHPEESQQIDHNLREVVAQGRKPGLLLNKGGSELPLNEWALEILGETQEIADLLDSITGNDEYKSSVQAQIEKVQDATLTPSAKVLARMKESNAPYFRFAMDQSLACSDYFRSKSLSQEALDKLESDRQSSIQEKEAIEASDTIDFDTYLRQHNASIPSNQ